MPHTVTVQLAPVEADALRYSLTMDLATAGENLGALCADADLGDAERFVELRARLDDCERRARALGWGSPPSGEVREVTLDPHELRSHGRDALEHFAGDLHEAVLGGDDEAVGDAMDRVNAARSLLGLAAVDRTDPPRPS
jgi:hypothetical protein